MSIVGSGSQGQDLYMRHLYSLANLDGVFNMVRRAGDRFRSPSDPGAGIFGTTVGGGNVTGIERDWPNSNFVWDASFFTIRNITLGYTFSKLPKAIRSARLYASAQTIIVLSNYWDGGNLSPGVDLGPYPVPRTITFGANINF